MTGITIRHNITKIGVIFLLILLSITPCLHADHAQRNCLILLDHDNYENVGVSDSWFLMSRLQSAIAEQTTPILLHTSLWNSFIERRINFEQHLQQQNTPLFRIYNLYQSINERMEYLSHYYNSTHHDVVQNKNLAVQHINQEFYRPRNAVSDENYQLLLDYLTHFDSEEWTVYKNNGGFYLLIPKKYHEQNSLLGFNIDSLEEVPYPEDTSSAYFESRVNESIVNALPDFFLTYDDLPNASMPYSWNILLAGHGGAKYQETNRDETISWIGEPIIADLSIHEFSDVLEFFQSRVTTNLFHYSTCNGGGNHIPLVFKNEQRKPYRFAIICDTLTDCVSYCKWTTLLPSDEKKFLTTADVIYDTTKDCWQLPLAPVYHWGDFFKGLATIDFSTGSIERLQEMMSSITYSIIANIPLLCLPETHDFFPLYSSDVIKIDDRFLTLAENESDSITVNGAKTVLIESSSIMPTIIVDHINRFRMISIKPGDALHYIKKLKATHHIDLPSTFWQAQFQWYDKTFIVDECTFPYSNNSLIFKDIVVQGNELRLEKVIISQQKSHYIRLFFTINDIAMMVVAHKSGQAELNENATIQEVVLLSETARNKYEDYYSSLRKRF